MWYQVNNLITKEFNIFAILSFSHDYYIIKTLSET